ncbi:MAG TPA: cytosine permease [Rhodanobacteraceae bacterium]|nr:cytosine permease [Rhodanobacteraceae bacterium]
MTATGETGASHAGGHPSGVELNGLNTIAECERGGQPRSLFWPWFAANVSVLGVSYGAFLLGFGISLRQAALVAVAGIVVSYLFCGLIALAGKRGAAPTLTLSRAAFGVTGNRLPSLISWLLTVGWETVLVSLAVLATATVCQTLGIGGGTLTKAVSLIAVVALVVGGGIYGFHTIMRLQTVITVLTAALTLVYIALALQQLDFSALGARSDGSPQAMIGAFVFTLTGFGLGWVQAAADYSRYLPRHASSVGVVAWTTVGAALAPVILVLFGLLLAGASASLGSAIGSDPIGALTGVLPHGFLLPFALVAVLGLIGGAILDIYSSGLALLSCGVNIPRPLAAAIDGALMTVGAIWIVFFAHSFIDPFQAFLITLGTPIAAWCGIFLADLTLRRRDYDEHALFDPAGRYGRHNVTAIALLAAATALGWGLVTNPMPHVGWMNWLGYLLEPLALGGRDGAWASANLGVLVALAVAYLGFLALAHTRVRRQESLP